MHVAVFEAGWSGDDLIKTHRHVVAVDHHGRGREVIGVDWPLFEIAQQKKGRSSKASARQDELNRRVSIWSA